MAQHGVAILSEYHNLYSHPSNTTVLGSWDCEKPAVFRNGDIGKEYNLEKPYLGLEMGSGIGRGGIGRDGIGRGGIGRGGIGRDDCTAILYKTSL